MIENDSFSYSLLGEVFYERGMMSISKVSDVESGCESDELDFGSESFTSVYDYAAYHEIPEYVFFGAAFDTPYQSLCAYRLENDTLTITAYGKELKLHRKAAEKN